MPKKRKKESNLFLKIVLFVVISYTFVVYSLPKITTYYNYKTADLSKNSQWHKDASAYLSLYFKSKELAGMGKEEDALKLLHEAMEYEPAHGKVYLMTGVVYMDLKKYELAEKYYLESLNHYFGATNKSIAHNNLGELYLDQYSYFKKAIIHFQKAIDAIESGKSEYIHPATGLIRALVYNNEYEKAKLALDQYKCDTSYCTWLQKTQDIPDYPVQDNEKRKIRHFFSDGHIREWQSKIGGWQRHGFARTYSDTGILLSHQMYIDGDLHGVTQEFNEQGELNQEIRYDHGVLMDEDGRPFSGVKKHMYTDLKYGGEIVYLNGVAHGSMKTYDRKGRLKMEATMKEGKPTGVSKVYYQNGQLNVESYHDIKDGIVMKKYHENGKVKEEYVVEDGKYSNVFTYDESGILIGDAMYPEVQAVEIVSAGQIKRDQLEKESKQLKRGGSICQLLDQPEFVHLTDEVTASKGDAFGIAFKVAGVPAEGMVQLKIKYIHPPLQDPTKDQMVTMEGHDLFARIDQVRTAGWVFDYDWELVPGEWRIQLFHEDQLMAEKIFNVTLTE